VPDDGLGLSEKYFDVGLAVIQIRGIVLHVPCRCSCHYELISAVLRQSGHFFCKFPQYRHHGTYLSFARTGEHGDYRFVLQSVAFQEIFPAFVGSRGVIDGIYQRVALVDEFHAFFAEIRYFKREDYEKFVYVFFQLFYASFAGSPYLRCDVVEYLESVFVGAFGYFEIESRIVDKYYHVRLP